MGNVGLIWGNHQKLFLNGQSEERFQEGKLRFVGWHRYNINQMSCLWQRGTYPRIMHHQGIQRLFADLLILCSTLKYITDLYHFLCSICMNLRNWEADLFILVTLLFRLLYCIQRWGMWRWTQMHYGQGLLLWSEELYKVWFQPFLLCYLSTNRKRLHWYDPFCTLKGKFGPSCNPIRKTAINYSLNNWTWIFRLRFCQKSVDLPLCLFSRLLFYWITLNWNIWDCFVHNTLLSPLHHTATHILV